MKKLLTLSLVAVALVFASCDNAAKDAEKAKQDSIFLADSLAKVKATEDSIAIVKVKADSVVKADSIKKADSLKATTKKVVKK